MDARTHTGRAACAQQLWENQAPIPAVSLCLERTRDRRLSGDCETCRGGLGRWCLWRRGWKLG